MQQYQDLKLNPFKIRHCTILVCFGLLGHCQVLEIRGGTAVPSKLPRLMFSYLQCFKLSQCGFIVYVLSLWYDCCVSSVQCDVL
jgi:hypothetical protein